MRLSSRSVNEVNTAIGIDDATQFADLEAKSGILKRLLHLSTLEETEVSASPRRGAVPV